MPASRVANTRKRQGFPRSFALGPIGIAVARGCGVQSPLEHAPLAPSSPVKIRVVGPDAASLTPTDLRRLFRGRRLTPARRERLRNSGRVVAACGSRVVGLAAYERYDTEIRVHEFGVDEGASCSLDQIATALLDALEIACLAGGGRRLVLLPRAALTAHLLRARGFVPIAEESAGSWFEKTFPS
jgi:hypothetical protein